MTRRFLSTVIGNVSDVLSASVRHINEVTSSSLQMYLLRTQRSSAVLRMLDAWGYEVLAMMPEWLYSCDAIRHSRKHSRLFECSNGNEDTHKDAARDGEKKRLALSLAAAFRSQTTGSKVSFSVLWMFLDMFAEIARGLSIHRTNKAIVAFAVYNLTFSFDTRND